MRRRFTVLLTALLLVAAFASTAFALEAPKLTGRVNDLAGMISPDAEQRITAALAELEQTDGTQVVLLTIPTLDGDSLEEFSIRVAHDAWKLGQEKEDNGVLFLVAQAERKVRIEVGYGLEGVLTDVLSGSIIDQVITPQFKEGNFDMGFMAGTAAIIQAVKGEYVAPKKSKKKSGGIGFLPILIIIFVIFHMITPSRGRVVRTADGQKVVRGSGAGSILPWLILGSMSGRGGGGGFGGGGFGGGGFGGGMGGGFGGGGASGGW